MSSVFKTYPAVKKKHGEYVPHRMTESEFWTLFFQSHYYSVHTTSRTENVFSECSKYDDRGKWVTNRVCGNLLFNLSVMIFQGLRQVIVILLFVNTLNLGRLAPKWAFLLSCFCCICPDFPSYMKKS